MVMARPDESCRRTCYSARRTLSLTESTTLMIIETSLPTADRERRLLDMQFEEG